MAYKTGNPPVLDLPDQPLFVPSGVDGFLYQKNKRLEHYNTVFTSKLSTTTKSNITLDVRAIPGIGEHTINDALALIPDIINHTVTLNINGDIGSFAIFGHSGGGELIIQGIAIDHTDFTLPADATRTIVTEGTGFLDLDAHIELTTTLVGSFLKININGNDELFPVMVVDKGGGAAASDRIWIAPYRDWSVPVLGASATFVQLPKISGATVTNPITELDCLLASYCNTCPVSINEIDLLGSYAANVVGLSSSGDSKLNIESCSFRALASSGCDFQVNNSITIVNSFAGTIFGDPTQTQFGISSSYSTSLSINAFGSYNLTNASGVITSTSDQHVLLNSIDTENCAAILLTQGTKSITLDTIGSGAICAYANGTTNNVFYCKNAVSLTVEAGNTIIVNPVNASSGSIFAIESVLKSDLRGAINADPGVGNTVTASAFIFSGFGEHYFNALNCAGVHRYNDLFRVNDKSMVNAAGGITCANTDFVLSGVTVTGGGVATKTAALTARQTGGGYFVRFLDRTGAIIAAISGAYPAAGDALQDSVLDSKFISLS